MLYTAAMLLDANPNDLVEILGHSGTESVYESDDPNKRLRGFHIQEMVELFLEHEKALVRVERYPIIGPDFSQAIDAFRDSDQRFWDRIWGNEAYLLGSSVSGFHAVAWDGERVYDPRGYVYSLPSDKFDPKEAWLVYDI